MHGPNYGYGHDQFLIYLSDGSETDPGKGLSLVRYMKEVHQSGIAVGDVPEELGLKLSLTKGCFSFIEMSALVQLMAYMLTQAIGRDVSHPIDHSDMNTYFTTHSDTKPQT